MQGLTTERLRLRDLDAADAGFILELVNEPDFIANIRDMGVRDLAQARAYIEEGPRASYARHGFGLQCVELKQTCEPIGICGLVRRDTLPEPDLGYAILARFHGRGYAREAAAAALAHARDALGLARVLAITAPANQPSARVLAALGFREEGDIVIGGKPTKLYVWELEG